MFLLLRNTLGQAIEPCGVRLAQRMQRVIWLTDVVNYDVATGKRNPDSDVYASRNCATFDCSGILLAALWLISLVPLHSSFVHQLSFISFQPKSVFYHFVQAYREMRLFVLSALCSQFVYRLLKVCMSSSFGYLDHRSHQTQMSMRDW